jgi:hypothetical protein
MVDTKFRRPKEDVMDAVWLPVLNVHESLKNAVDAMRLHKCSGLLVEDDGSYNIAYIGSVLRAIDQHKKTLKSISFGSDDTVLLANNRNASQFKVDLVRPMRTGTQYEVFLDSKKSNYSVVAQARDFALVVTRHEQLRDMLAQSNTFYCDGKPKHYFPRPMVTVSQDCPSCVGPNKGKIFQKS